MSGTKFAPMPWILCGPGVPPLRIGDSAGSTPMICTPGLRSFRTWPTPVIVPPVPMPATTMSTAPSVSSQISTAVVRRWISGLAGLANCRARMEPGRSFAMSCRLVHGALHAQRTGGQDQFGTVGAQQGPALLGHGLGHREHHVVAARGTDEGKRDPGVAAGRLDDGPAGRQLAGPFGGVDDGDADAVLDRTCRVVELELGHDGRVPAPPSACSAGRGGCCRSAS